ncbi:MAG: hypothetical protein M1812_004672 [Candelaria pacifica]|nr:MAG: hypothetical protein M1812_004672 [Candelaria pacifica]
MASKTCSSQSSGLIQSATKVLQSAPLRSLRALFNAFWCWVSGLTIAQTEPQVCFPKDSSAVLDKLGNLVRSPPLTQVTKPFPIMDLPGELRMLIYSYICGALALDVEVRTSSRGLSYWAVDSAQPSISAIDNDTKYSHLSKLSFGALLQTNHQVRREASHLLYLQSTFQFPSPGVLRRFLKEVKPHHLKQIRSLKIDYDVSASWDQRFRNASRKR